MLQMGQAGCSCRFPNFKPWGGSSEISELCGCLEETGNQNLAELGKGSSAYASEVGGKDGSTHRLLGLRARIRIGSRET